MWLYSFCTSSSVSERWQRKQRGGGNGRNTEEWAVTWLGLIGVFVIILSCVCVQFPMSDQPHVGKEAPRCHIPLTCLPAYPGEPGKERQFAMRSNLCWEAQTGFYTARSIAGPTGASWPKVPLEPRGSCLWLARLSLMGGYGLLQVSGASAGSRVGSWKGCQRRVWGESTCVGEDR